ncbi:MAG: serine hydrolase [Porticoccaceae bacterium]|nr:serine hydrolase [Porticoccaceae bacterium]
MKIYIYIGVILLTFIPTASAEDKSSFKDWRDTVTKSNFSGVVLVASENKVLFKEAFGLANREKNIPFSENTILDISSLTKQFTAAAILKLQESNQLSVNDSLTKFFNNVPNDKKKITVHHLLTHTAGFITNRGGGSSDLYDIVTKKELIETALKSKLLASPGQGYNYSNVGYNLLAIIIEKITADNYEDFYYENLFEPADLTETGYRLPKRTVNGVAINYGADQTAYQRLFSIDAKSLPVGNPFQHLKSKEDPRFNMEGAGGMSSTVGDLFRWYMALSSNLILADESKKQLFLPHNSSLEKASKSHYGYGWDIKSTTRGILHAQHNGSNGYSFADMHYFVDENIILATNDIDVYPQL